MNRADTGYDIGALLILGLALVACLLVGAELVRLT